MGEGRGKKKKKKQISHDIMLIVIHYHDYVFALMSNMSLVYILQKTC